MNEVLPYAAGSFVKGTIRDAGPDGFAGSLDDTGVIVDVPSQLSDPDRNVLEITNPAGAFRTSRGMVVTAAVPAGRGGALQGSWVLPKTTGNVDGDGAGPTLEYDSPTTDPALQPLRTGRVAADRTHMVRLFGSYRLPLGVRASAAFAWDSGRTFTRTLGVRVNECRVDVFAEPRGSQRYDPERRLDIRLERPLPGVRPLSISADAFNVLNDATVTRSGLQYFLPTAVSPARRIRLGVGYRF